MICISCKDGREQECWGLTKDKTWCDSQRRSGIILDQQFCKHLRFKSENEFCPTCGKLSESITADEQAMEADSESSLLLGE